MSQINAETLRKALQKGPPETIGYGEQSIEAFRHGWNAAMNSVYEAVGLGIVLVEDKTGTAGSTVDAPALQEILRGFVVNERHMNDPELRPVRDRLFALARAAIDPAWLPPEVNTTPAREEGRWACPKCDGRHVQVALPAWHRETAGLNLDYVETDGEAEVLYWYCEDCEAEGQGEPIDTMALPSVADVEENAETFGGIEATFVLVDDDGKPLPPAEGPALTGMLEHIDRTFVETFVGQSAQPAFNAAIASKGGA